MSRSRQDSSQQGVTAGVYRKLLPFLVAGVLVTASTGIVAAHHGIAGIGGTTVSGMVG